MQFLLKLLNDDPHAKEQYNKGRVEIVTNVEETIKKISNVINGNSGDGNRNEGATNASTKTTSSSISTSLGTSLTDDMLLGEEEASFISVPKPLKINPKNSELGLAIDTGGSAEVFFLKIFNKAGQSAIAVFKQFKVHSNSIKEVEIKMIEEEIEILSHLKHDNIVKIFGAIGDPNARDVKGERIGVGIVMEYCENGSLRSLLNKNANNQQQQLLNMDLIIHILCEAAKGVQYLHNHMPRAIIHGDIKSDNILIDKEYNTKLCDFGISKLVQTTTASRTNIGQNLGGTIAYKAPETFNGEMGCASDVYSFGCVILEMLTGDRPWNELGNNVGMIVTKVLVMKEQHNLSKVRTDTPGKLIDLMKRCLDYDKDKRPTMNEVRMELEQMMNNAVLITLDNTSDECKMVENKFFPGEDKEGSLNRNDYRIVKIDKIRHLFAERRYDAELSNINSILNDDDANEQLLFHGTSQTDPMMILNHPDAFMKDYSSQGFYGRGLYFAELARYSNAGYRHNISNTNQYQMLVCSVICGNSLEHGITVSDETQKQSQKDLGTDYQSIHAGPHRSRCAGPGEDDSRMYVIYKDTQVVPKYMITYEKIPSN